MTEKVDLAILGGGCAGLSLARGLAQAQAAGIAIPNTIVIEPRRGYAADRTWCFWEPRDRRNSLVQKRWSRWRFSSAGNRSIVHTSDAWRYCCVPAGHFYKTAIGQVRAAEGVQLDLGKSVLEVRPKSGGVQIDTANGKLWARWVVDTRPPQPDRLSASRLFQQFSGVEVEGDFEEETEEVVGLMENLTTDEFGMRFDYVLPLGPGRRLIEATRFSATQLPKERLEEDLAQSLGRLTANGDCRIIRSEQGLIPMGMPREPGTSDDALVKAGTGGAAVRAATGYAFQRIQGWANHCVESLCAGEGPVPHPPGRRVEGAMDRLFLEILHERPEIGPKLFMALAEQVSADALVRFLIDEGTPSDLFAVIWSLPSAPFLKQLAMSARPRSKRRRLRSYAA